MKNKPFGSYCAEIVRNILVSQDPKEDKRLYEKLKELEIKNNKK